jgi:hypothetical protein
MPARRFHRPHIACALACALAAACATVEETPPPRAQKEPPAPAVAPSKPPAVAAPVKPRPVAPPEPVAEAPKEPLRSLGVDELSKAVRSYDDGDYAAAAKQFQAALDLGLVAPADRALAYKHLAFMACVAGRVRVCRGEFRKAFGAQPDFDLSPAEAGHPTWGPVFRSVKAEAARAAKAKQKPR